MAFEGICSFFSSLMVVFQDLNRLPYDFWRKISLGAIYLEGSTY
jgi:hypothetical protein